VRLRLRVQRTGAVRRCCVKYGIGPDDPLIRIEESKQSPTEAFAAIYSEVHCTVHPSKGEGFGLIPFQSIACETPVIAPRSTGMADYLDESNAMLLRTKGVCDTPDVYYAEGRYPAIDEDHLVELLRHAEANWEAEYGRLQRIAPAFRARHTWDNALAEIVALIGDLIDIDDPVARRALIRERVGH
jgi:glycosyltransferase involved in cell wall biosynthesis